MPLRRLVLLVLMLTALAACRDEPTGRRSLPVVQRDIPFRHDGTLDLLTAEGAPVATLSIEIAATDSAHARGLMQRREMPPQTGMLFVYPDAAPRSFWMRNTPMPLDILFIDAEGQVLNVARRTRPLSDDEIRSEGAAQLVLELRAGTADRLGLAPGQRVRWRRAP